MSRENVERFHRIYEEWYARRKLSPDVLAEDVEWVNPHDAVERGSTGDRQLQRGDQERLRRLGGGSLRTRAHH